MVYSEDELYGMHPQRVFPGSASAVAFPLGGIGTGNVSLGARGELRDWEIFNRPAKGFSLPNTYFALWARPEGESPVTKVLQSLPPPPHTQSHGYHPTSGLGLPHFTSTLFRGEYPIAWVYFEDSDLPIKVTLESFTPFVPLNAEDSGIPGAYLIYRVENISPKRIDVAIAASITNPVGEVRRDRFGGFSVERGGNANDFRRQGRILGLFLRSNSYPLYDLRYGDLSLVTMNSHVTFKRVWLPSRWACDSVEEFWRDFSTDGKLEDLGIEDPSEEGQTYTGSIAAMETIAPGEVKDFVFILSWFFPNRIKSWDSDAEDLEDVEIVRNHYSRRFSSSWDVAMHLARRYDELRSITLSFHDALFNSTLPTHVIDAVASNITVLRSPTCFWLEDGSFMAWEGCFDDAGCCAGTCTHVWNYAQTVAFLFPDLERLMRRSELLVETNQEGKMNFRGLTSLGQIWDHEAAADGQLGTVIRVYREWKFSGDDAFLKELWPKVKSAVNYSSLYWDKDQDFILEGRQHNTYDIEFYGPNPLTGILFLGALRAAEEMAKYLGSESASSYAQAFEASSKKLDQLLWNGEYYIQKLDDPNEHRYQHASGCLSDQLFGQTLASLTGLGYLLPKEHISRALESIFAYNFKPNFWNHTNTQRVYALGDDAGLVMCTWPFGDRPSFPFPYSDEVWSGTEYQVATLMIYEGLLDEALTIIRATRDRYDGFKRNPWDEVECGHHYARSMASWGLLIALSGFYYDGHSNTMTFDPKINKENFACFWSTSKAWGTFSQTTDPQTGNIIPRVEVLYGDAQGMKVLACGQEINL
ncbi:protein of unknown function DUF608 [Thermobaculum terrenum ATCC BAA-798]|uniref:Glucosylceramidase n=1 Tax=Thermobaculum terrenum (strain ATCC BAA-798 / CCMEE 7001 / YNP1) TaxID=525904 RepID=D1CDX7_THET1|nr:GH116 family glycosyl-hydrolase [Thermobaculum terrenum]ACZ41133.1 protein of unknown function DUF608 [Thermobaculum terrenum ATCC BAA-798]